MAARGSKGNAALAAVVRERQDLVAEWEKRDAERTAAVSQPPNKRNKETEAANAVRLTAIDERIATIDRGLAVQFPDYAALARPRPLAIEEVQADLRSDEALVLFLDADESGQPAADGTFIWVVTKSDSRWARTELDTSLLAREVDALRCGLISTAWNDTGSTKCAMFLRIARDQAPKGNQPLPFNHVRAHKLYTALFGEVQNLIKGKHLLIVPSGPLTQLPFQVLVTKPPVANDHRAAAWLSRDHAITILPAVSSLKALRRVGKPSAAPRPMVGFGNPLLDGPSPGYAESAKLARAKQRCPEAQTRQKLAIKSPARAAAIYVPTCGGLVDLAELRVQAPLPETADELCAVAHDVKAKSGDIHLAERATERVLKGLSTSGELAKYRMVHFATHGVLAGELDGTMEPGLILTPPDKATEDDDGYLSASEIAALRLDADWVILSACNTAAGGATDVEALSGLARAFFYAQARALLVSHWAVDSDATVKLITSAVGEIARDPKVGRAEALRRAMLALLDKGEMHEAHPAYWAPFVVVGEGSAQR